MNFSPARSEEIVMSQPPLPLLRRAGIGLRAPHVAEFIAVRPPVAFVEVHSENHFGRGGRPLQGLLRVRQDHAVSLHGVGLSIGSADPLDLVHLQRLRELIGQVEPALVSEHLSWSSIGGEYANDLLPLPLTRAALAHVTARVQEVQDRLGRRILMENVSSYLEFAQPEMAEWEFLGELSRRSGCGLLLDVNNLYVSACNHGFDARAYLEAMPAEKVEEIHLAGHTRRVFEDGEILIDTHSAPVADAVWSLYAQAIERFGPVPTLIEWDAELPPLAALVAEAQTADRWAARAAGRRREQHDACLA